MYSRIIFFIVFFLISCRDFNTNISGRIIASVDSDYLYLSDFQELNYDFKTKVLVASIRSTQHVIDAAIIGAHVSTLPPKVIHELYNHPLTDKGLTAFLEDWKKTGQSILPK